MSNIFVFRHAEKEFGKLKLSNKPYPLDPSLAKQPVEKIVQPLVNAMKYIKKKNISTDDLTILSSPLARTRETALEFKIYLKSEYNIDANIVIEPYLIDDIGNKINKLLGMASKKKENGKKYLSLNPETQKYTIINKVKFGDYRKIYNEIIDKYREKTIFIITHWPVITNLRKIGRKSLFYGYSHDGKGFYYIHNDYIKINIILVEHPELAAKYGSGSEFILDHPLKDLDNISDTLIRAVYFNRSVNYPEELQYKIVSSPQEASRVTADIFYHTLKDNFDIDATLMVDPQLPIFYGDLLIDDFIDFNKAELLFKPETLYYDIIIDTDLNSYKQRILTEFFMLTKESRDNNLIIVSNKFAIDIIANSIDKKYILNDSEFIFIRFG